jgi:hypothetical protein
MNAYVEFSWGVYHALFLTSILVLAFELRYAPALIGDTYLWSIMIVAVFAISALYLRARLIKYGKVLPDLLSDGD